jgi:hypothetical protein
LEKEKRMIPAPPGLQAHYERTATDGTTRFTILEVLAFNEDGIPLVLGGEKHGYGLVPASSYRGFTGIWPNEDKPYVAALPGDGWRVEHTGDDGHRWSEPVVCWAVTSGGYAEALVSDGGGGTQSAAAAGEEVRVYREGEPPQES